MRLLSISFEIASHFIAKPRELNLVNVLVKVSYKILWQIDVTFDNIYLHGIKRGFVICCSFPLTFRRDSSAKSCWTLGI